MKHICELRNGLESAFLDQNINSNLAYRPEFVSNDYRRGKRVISSIEQELRDCEEFFVSVAFITLGGLTPLLQIFKELNLKGIKGKILTTDYLAFNDPAALDKLNSLPNIELKMFCSNEDKDGFHTKGYIFKKEEIYRIIVGSANMTAGALKINREWNTKLVGYESGEVIGDILREFHLLWNDQHCLDYEDFIESYRTRYELIKKQKKIAIDTTPVSLEQYKLQPNAMQVAFVKNIKELIDKKEHKALLISATGTGKTYASAFALREINPRRVLFLVHREQIAKQALDSYHIVFGDKRINGSAYRYALLSGNTSGNIKNIKESDLVFATMQMMSKDNILNEFPKDAFSVIVLDEAHHSGAGSYQKIMNYFQPDFWLGMTASPETERFDVYEIFDHNIAYEIRLQQALEEDLLCPFHYFGITDLSIDGEIIGDEDSLAGLRSFNRLVSDDRVNYIIEQAKYYGYSGERVKGLIFCSRREEAKMLSQKFNERGLRTEVLTGEDNETRREKIIERLVQSVTKEMMPRADYLDYIFTVDIFSEGVDIPEVNQVIMLRPTQSAIVFVQQLGRGLRKAKNKDFVVILDFIGNYKNNFLIPIALSGDRSYNKDNIRRYVMEGDRVIPGASTIHFDEISRKRIFSAIDSANFSDIKLIKENYTYLKYKLGKIPALKDFDKYGEMDVCRIFDNNSLGSYYKFLVKYEKEYTIRLSEKKERIVEFISKKLVSGKRIYELELLKRLLKYQHGILGLLEKNLWKDYGISMDSSIQKNVINIMTNEFASGSSKKTYASCIFIKKEGAEYGISDSFGEMLRDQDFYDIVEELVDFGISRYNTNFSKKYQDTDFVLYQKYTYEDVCRILNWETNEVPLNIGGYKYDKKTKTFPVFINYDKSDDISESTKYEDHFINANTLIGISKSGRTMDSDDVQNLLHARERGIDVHLFVRKNKDDKISKEFYYLGRMNASGNAEEVCMNNTIKTAVEIEWTLDTPVRDDIYQYIIG
ncbi:DEAD/DEAH box helicase [Lacrimispora sp. NSJ-141]|uniref:DEAD/DEAH box helicase n=1 Tax=Lientehia hominis TaxID=2897778 RepID=A0AAP2W981_9FIRM|nr:DEAD/DEAH box helicase [Lientehia hominis]MCD2492971.1 DEAD/DEAH box helicase [Lientehia hominis]